MVQNNRCPTALRGDSCTNSTCSKDHDYILCKPCGLILHINTFKAHTSGKKHLQKVASSGPPSNPGTVQQALPSQPASSNRQSSPYVTTLPLSVSSTPTAPTADASPRPLVTGSGKGDSHTKVPYCATTLQGGTCIDPRCQYRHDVVRCEPCGRSFPASLFNQHQSSSSHVMNVVSHCPTNSSTSQCPPPSPNPRPTPPQISAPPPWGNPSILAADSRVTVSHEGGLDFIADGTGTVADPCFPPISHTILVENTSSLFTLSVQSMKLVPSPSPWCESFGVRIQFLTFLLVALARIYSARRY
jgi:hypothetical protein